MHRPTYYDRWGDEIKATTWAPYPERSAMSARCFDGCNGEFVSLDHSPESRTLKEVQ